MWSLLVALLPLESSGTSEQQSRLPPTPPITSKLLLSNPEMLDAGKLASREISQARGRVVGVFV